MRRTNFTALALYGLASIACTTGPIKGYEGPALPDNETALISAQRVSNDRTVARVRIRSYDTVRGEAIAVRADRVRVFPRRTCVEAVATTSTLDSFAAELCFEAVQGRHYEIRALTRGSPLPPQLVSSGADIPITVNPESGPFTVTMLLVIDASTQEIVAAAEP